MAKRSPHFFTYGNNPIAKLPDYLDSILKKMYNVNTVINVTSSSNGTKNESVVEVVTKAQLEKLAENLGEKWAKVLPKLGMDKEESDKIKENGKNDKGEFNRNSFMN